MSATETNDNGTDESGKNTPENTDTGSLYRFVFLFSVHAPMLKRYSMQSNSFEELGDESQYGRVDPETGAMFRALGGTDHRYNKDYKIGPSYGETLFVYGSDGEANTVSHEVIEAALREHDEWTDAFSRRVKIPNGSEGGQWTWWNGFQVTPPERAPSSVKRMVTRLENKFGEDNVLHFGGNSIEVYVPRDE